MDTDSDHRIDKQVRRVLFLTIILSGVCILVATAVAVRCGAGVGQG